jgi:hypothetical protein
MPKIKLVKINYGASYHDYEEFKLYIEKDESSEWTEVTEEELEILRNRQYDLRGKNIILVELLDKSQTKIIISDVLKQIEKEAEQERKLKQQRAKKAKENEEKKKQRAIEKAKKLLAEVENNKGKG